MLQATQIDYKIFINELVLEWNQFLNEINGKQGIMPVGDMNVDISIDNGPPKIT